MANTNRTAPVAWSEPDGPGYADARTRCQQQSRLERLRPIVGCPERQGQRTPPPEWSELEARTQPHTGTFPTSSRVIVVRWIRMRSFSDCRRTVIVSRSSSTSVPRTDGPPPGAADGCPPTTPGACAVVTLTLAPGRATTRSEARDTPTPPSKSALSAVVKEF